MRVLYKFLNYVGIDIVKLARFFYGLPWFIRDYIAFNRELKNNKDFKISSINPNLSDKNDSGGTMKGSYFHQDLLIAKKIFKNNPKKHVDIGSRTDGFVSHVASFREIEIFDIRDISTKVENIVSTKVDFTSPDFNLKNYTDSISSLHAIEHFGLGRYGDKIDVNGHILGLEVIYSCLKQGGQFYFSTPIGPQRIEFNAHRVFDVGYLLKLFNNKYKIDSFSYVNDYGDLFENISLNNLKSTSNNFGCNYGCGIFTMTKL